MTHEEKSIWLLVLGGQIDLALTIGEGIACNAWKTLCDWIWALDVPIIAYVKNRDYYLTRNHRNYTPINALRVYDYYMETDGYFPENIEINGKIEKGILSRYYCNKKDEDDFIIIFVHDQVKCRKHLKASIPFIKRIGAGLAHWQYNAIAKQVERWGLDNCESECYPNELPF